MMMIDGQILWDSTSKRLNGFFELLTDSTYTAPAVMTNIPVTAVDPTVGVATTTGPAQSPSNFSFFLTGIFGTGNAANAATVTEFSLFGL